MCPSQPMQEQFSAAEMEEPAVKWLLPVSFWASAAKSRGRGVVTPETFGMRGLLAHPAKGGIRQYEMQASPWDLLWQRSPR